MPCNCRRGLGPHDHLGDASYASDATLAVGVPLNSYITPSMVQYWNAKGSPQQCTSLLFTTLEGGSDTNVVVSSDADAELLIWVPFQEAVRLRGISIEGSGDGFAPVSVRLFANRGGTEVRGFESVARLQPDETLQLGNSSTHDNIIYRVNPIKFVAVESMALWFPGETFGSEDETHLSKITFYGESTGRPTERRVATNLVYESSANPADHKLLEDGTKTSSMIM